MSSIHSCTKSQLQRMYFEVQKKFLVVSVPRCHADIISNVATSERLFYNVWVRRPCEPCHPVAAPGHQGSQVINRSLRSWGRSSGANHSAVKEPGHFEVRKSSSQVTGCTFFLKKADLPARSFDLARPGVAPPLTSTVAAFSSTHCYSPVCDRRCQSPIDKHAAVYSLSRSSIAWSVRRPAYLLGWGCNKLLLLLLLRLLWLTSTRWPITGVRDAQRSSPWFAVSAVQKQRYSSK